MPELLINSLLLIDMLDIGSRIAELRKAANWSQEELAKKIGSSRVMIGNYERNSNTPSIDILLKLAQVFDVSVDFLVGQGKAAKFNKETLARIEDMDLLDKQTREILFNVIDTYIQNYKTKKAFGK